MATIEKKISDLSGEEGDNGAAIFAAKYLTAAVDRGLHRVEPILGCVLVVIFVPLFLPGS